MTLKTYERQKALTNMTPEEKELIEKFQLLVDKKDNESCWEWLGEKSAFQEGLFLVGGDKIEAHILSWLIFYGFIPEGKEVWHRCSSISCVNPYHLFLEDKNILSPDVFYSLPNNFKELMPGTYFWMEFWRAHPEQQEKMIKYRREVEG